MTVSSLANQKLDIPAGNRWSRREDKVRGFTIHHQAGYNAHAAATAAGREVSAQYWIDNEGPIRPQVNEEFRAFTTGHAGYPEGARSDHRNITAEVSNTKRGAERGTWEISEAAKESLAALIGDVFRRYKLGRVRRGTYGGVAVHRDFVATECPGDPMVRALPDIIERAEWYRVHGGKPGDRTKGANPKPAAKPQPKPKPIPAPIPVEDEMHTTYMRDTKDKNGTIWMINSAGKRRALRKAEWENLKAQRRSMGMEIPPVEDVSAEELAKYPKA
ncbi:peptidoglycan recognition protein family protein [Leucobacter chromiiresistens]